MQPMKKTPSSAHLQRDQHDQLRHEAATEQRAPGVDCDSFCCFCGLNNVVKLHIDICTRILAGKNRMVRKTRMAGILYFICCKAGSNQ